jgi:BMFP domain-containing protein YqiC
MKKIKYSILFLSAIFLLSISGCGIFPPPFFFYSHNHSDWHKDRKDLKAQIKLDEKCLEKIHDKLEKMKMKIMNKNDTLNERLNRMNDRLEQMNKIIDSLNRDFSIMNDSYPSGMNIEINPDNLDEIINSSLKDLDKEIELSVTGSLSHLDEIDKEDFDTENENVDIKVEKMDGDKVMIIKYFDEDSDEWKEIKINMPHNMKIKIERD